ncbi:MAG TPA: FHA domain-containing protein [Pyrinomonadaceae bacterium]|nr:FHA domain-containing protein [Pyrinomonadaceae bacterium]
MNQVLLGLAFQDADESQMWIILAVVLVILFFIVVIVVVGLVIFFVMRKRKKDLSAGAPDVALSAGPGASDYAVLSQPEAPPASASYPETQYPGMSQPEPAYAPMSSPETAETLDPDMPLPISGSQAAGYNYSPEAAPAAEPEPFDPSRTVAIIRENTVSISYGTIKFVSGVLTGQQFNVEPEGAFIGRDNNLSQIVVADQRISKRHLWIGVRDGVVKIADQDSRNGTFLNDPKSDRVTEATLNPGDTVIMGESDVARFEYQGGDD